MVAGGAHGGGPAVWPGAPGSGPGEVLIGGRDAVLGQAAVVPQTCTWPGAVRVVMLRGAQENDCLVLRKRRDKPAWRRR